MHSVDLIAVYPPRVRTRAVSRTRRIFPYAQFPSPLFGARARNCAYGKILRYNYVYVHVRCFFVLFFLFVFFSRKNIYTIQYRTKRYVYVNNLMSSSNKRNIKLKLKKKKKIKLARPPPVIEWGGDGSRGWRCPSTG